MSLSTLTQCHPSICTIQRVHDGKNLLKEPPPVDWQRIKQVALIAAGASTLSQLVSAPLDVTTRAIKLLQPSSPLSKPTLPNMGKLILNIIREGGGIGAAFQGLPLHLIKRVPTKLLTVALFEMGNQLVTHNINNNNKSSLTAFQHVSIATFSGAAALLTFYPVHMVYYALRKYVPLAHIFSKAVAQPSILYTGAIPALLGTVPAVMVDYTAYRLLSSRIHAPSSQSTVITRDANVKNTSLQNTENDQRWKTMSMTMMLIGAAAAANVMGGFMSEPFKSVGRKMVVQAVRGDPSPFTQQSINIAMTAATATAATTQCSAAVSIAGTAGAMLERGVGEFWRGFPLRSIRYTVSALVSKASVQHLKGRSDNRLTAGQNVLNNASRGEDGGGTFRKGAAGHRENWKVEMTTMLVLPKRGYAAHLIAHNMVATRPQAAYSSEPRRPFVPLFLA